MLTTEFEIADSFPHKAETMNSPIEIRRLQESDLQATSQTHLLAFPESALTALGWEAVRRYYEWQLNGPHDVSALAAYRGNEMAGFCFGGIFRGAMSGFLQKNRNYLALRVITHPWLALNPLFRDRLATSLKILRRFSKPRPSSAQAVQANKPRKKSFGILSIAVNPNFQGQGVGKLLMLESEKIARQGSFEEMNLSVSTQNHQAIRFYEGLGWRKVSREGSWHGEMIKPFYNLPV
jgi:ribosomal protein S18 acetylase RimI-like enzyme